MQEPSSSHTRERDRLLEDLLLQEKVSHEPAQAGVLPPQILQAVGLLDLTAALHLAPGQGVLLRDSGVLAGERDVLALGELHLDRAQRQALGALRRSSIGA
ncbi:hypothetical protein AB8841_05185 [Microvirga sp. TS319]